jgi:hypothetical protein
LLIGIITTPSPAAFFNFCSSNLFSASSESGLMTSVLLAMRNKGLPSNNGLMFSKS